MMKTIDTFGIDADMRHSPFMVAGNGTARGVNA